MAKPYSYKIRTDIIDNRSRYVPCSICGVIIEANDTAHIATHRDIDLVAHWITWQLDPDVAEAPFHLYDLRKLILQRTDITERQLKSLDYLARWLDRHGVAYELVKSWIAYNSRHDNSDMWYERFLERLRRESPDKPSGDLS